MPSTNIFATKDSVIFVGGRGTKAGDANAGGGCTKTFWGDLENPSKALSDIMGTNGEPLSHADAWNGSQTACAQSRPGAGLCRFTLAGKFTNCIVGMIANVSTAGVVPVDTADRYEIVDVDPSGDWVDINWEPVNGGGTGDVKAGGAIDKLQNASDVSTASHADGSNNVFILTNKAETFSSVADEIDIDTGQGDAGAGTWKRVIGIDSSGVKLTEGNYTIIDANTLACNCIAINLVDNVSIHHIHAYNQGSSESGFRYLTGALVYNLSIMYCKATGGGIGVRVDSSNIRNFSLIGGEYDGLLYAALMTAYFGGNISDADFYSPGFSVILFGPYSIPVTGCIIRSDGTGEGIKMTNTNLATISHNIFYNVTDGIVVASANATVVEHSNVFMVSLGASGKAINRTNGQIAYSDYSCLYAMDGVAPAAADRWGGSGIGPNSIEANPQFVDAASNDFRLKLSSPAYRSGKPTLGQL